MANKLAYIAFPKLVTTELGVQCVAEFRFHPVRRWRFDYALPAYKIAVEVEGGVWVRGRHTRPQGYLNDIEKYNTATLLGWRILRITPQDLTSRKTIAMLKNAVLCNFDPEKMAKNEENEPFF